VSGSRPVAIVVQRYGEDVTGGSESLARALAVRLASRRAVTVFTSCARDYVTWRNEYAEGSVRVGGVEVLRFASGEERDLDAFNALSDGLYGKPHTAEDEHLWLRRQGPFVPGLVERLRQRRDDFAAVLFFTYLYYPSYWGLKAAPERSILVPTTHDEPALGLRVFEEVFAAPKAFAFLTRPEEALVRSRFAVGDRPAVVAGMGIEVPGAPDVEAFRIRHDVRGPYVLYAGRIDAGKGCAEMLAFYEQHRQRCRGAAELLLIGRLAMPEPRQPGVRYLGYLSEAEKHAAMAGARAVVCASPYESLSIVLLEAFALGTPGLVNGRSPVLRDHCVRANAGLYYTTAEEFSEGLELLSQEEGLRRALGENGRRYVEAEYRWDAVLARYEKLIETVSGPR
jgi:glycosyltransferase involved in cell wall biosynthesis